MRTVLSRRSFISRSITAGAGAGLLAHPASEAAAAPAALPQPSPARLPRWRGFNLLNKFNGRNDPFPERDFAWVSELGFNFVRLPMDYRGWIEGGDWTKLREATLKEIDDAVRFGRQHGVHVCLNFHRAPGYTVAQPPEPKPVWTDEEALRVCSLHWAEFARRYQGIPNENLSFNLFNEPPTIEPDVHRKVIARLVEVVREKDPKRLVICDGREWGNVAPTELAGLGVAAATRGYQPFKLTHYQASWVGNGGQWEEPGYPLKDGNTVWDKEMMRRRNIDPWKQLESQGVGVMVGEFGAFNKTPHKVVLDWLRDCLALWKEAGWGWAIWNFYGGFGILDSGRADVTYEDWRGHKLDRRLLDLLQAG
jgi:endoglucanase